MNATRRWRHGRELSRLHRPRCQSCNAPLPEISRGFLADAKPLCRSCRRGLTRNEEPFVTTSRILLGTALALASAAGPPSARGQSPPLPAKTTPQAPAKATPQWQPVAPQPSPQPPAFPQPAPQPQPQPQNPPAPPRDVPPLPPPAGTGGLGQAEEVTTQTTTTTARRSGGLIINNNAAGAYNQLAIGNSGFAWGAGSGGTTGVPAPAGYARPARDFATPPDPGTTAPTPAVGVAASGVLRPVPLAEATQVDLTRPGLFRRSWYALCPGPRLLATPRAVVTTTLSIPVVPAAPPPQSPPPPPQSPAPAPQSPAPAPQSPAPFAAAVAVPVVPVAPAKHCFPWSSKGR